MNNPALVLEDALAPEIIKKLGIPQEELMDQVSSVLSIGVQAFKPKGKQATPPGAGAQPLAIESSSNGPPLMSSFRQIQAGLFGIWKSERIWT